MNRQPCTSPWPAEDGGPARLQTVQGGRLQLGTGERLNCVSRATLFSTMTVLGPCGQVYLLTHSALRARLGLPTTACVERIDPLTLAPLCRSPRLAGGPMWPGGLALHPQGDLLVVYGRHIHRLGLDCQPLACRRLPEDEPYNSFVTLANGLVVTKNLSQQRNARLSVLDPITLRDAAAEVICPEPSVARLSAKGNTVYVVGLRSVMRFHWDDVHARLESDESWRANYLPGSNHSFAWDMVLTDTDAWFMDNGLHRYRFQMKGAGVSPGPNRLHRVSLSDSSDQQRVEICGLPSGSITNPPLVDPHRRIVLAYDSANGCAQAFAIMGEARQTRLHPLWRKHGLGCASHMLLYPASGEVVINDWHHLGEDVVVLDLASGAEKGRVRVGGWTQGVVFPCPGWQRDFYWSTMSRIARIYVS